MAWRSFLFFVNLLWQEVCLTLHTSLMSIWCRTPATGGSLELSLPSSAVAVAVVWLEGRCSSIEGMALLSRFPQAAVSSKSHVCSTLKLSGWASGSCKIVPDRWSKQKHTSTRGELSSVSLSPFAMYKLEANEIVTTAGNKWGTAHERPWGHHVCWHSWSTCKPVISS